MTSVNLMVPMTKFFADQRGYDLDNGYGLVQINPIGGKLIQFALQHLNHLKEDRILILSTQNQEDKILSSFRHSLSHQTDLTDFFDMIEKFLATDLTTSRRSLAHRETYQFQFQPMDCLSVGPDLWFLKEMNRARRAGLIYRIGDATPPLGLLESMGMTLVRYARNQQLI